jgi:hypothetical protein
MARAFSLSRPAYLPAYGRIQVDAGGRIWVEDYALAKIPPVFPQAWTVFDASGQPLGRVVIPAVPGVARLCPDCADERVRESLRLDLRSVGRDEVVLAWDDDSLGFPHVSLHRLQPVR